MQSFNRTAKRAMVLAIIVILVLAGAGAAGAGPWLRQAFARLFADTAGLDLRMYGPGSDVDAEPWPNATLRQAPWSEPSLRMLRGDEAWASGAPAGVSRLVPYAGFGLGVFRLSMNLAERSFGLSKERRQKSLRVFGGLGYALAPGLTTNLEYRALPIGEPPISFDLGGLAFDLDNPFQDHNFSLKLRYRF